MTTSLDTLRLAIETRNAKYPDREPGIRALRISQAKQGSCQWQYVDIVHYRIRIMADGQIGVCSHGRAERKYRSVAKAEREGLEKAGKLNYVWLGEKSPIGKVTEQYAEILLRDQAMAKWLRSPHGNHV